MGCSKCYIGGLYLILSSQDPTVLIWGPHCWVMLSPWIYKSFVIGTICAFWCGLHGSESSQSIFINCDFVFRKFLLRYYSKSPSYTTQTRADRFSQSCTKIERVCHKCGKNGHYAKECDASSYVLAIYKELQSLRKERGKLTPFRRWGGLPRAES